MKKTKKVMHSFTMNFLSAVDNPAQKGATALLMKRKGPATDEKGPPDTIEKFMAITNLVSGHSHLINNWNEVGGHTDWTLNAGDEYSHQHPWILNTQGEIEIGEINGHTHHIQSMSKNGVPILDTETEVKKKDEPMTEEEQKEFDALTKRVDISEAIGQLPDIQKTHYNSLEGDNASAFLKMSAEDRGLAMEALQEADPVVHTGTDGTEYRKSDDVRLIALAKRADRAENATKLEKAARLTQELQKRAADDMGHYPGDEITKVELMRAVAGIEDEKVQNDVFDMLKANNSKMAKAFETLGNRTILGEGTPEGDLDKLAKAHAAEHNVDEDTAYNAVLATDEGQRLYGETQEVTHG